MTISTTSGPHLSQELLESFHPRKLLLHASLYPIETPAISPAPQHSYSNNNNLHANERIVILVLICTIMSFCGVFCFFKCSIRGSTSPSAKLFNVGVKQKALNAFPIVKYASDSNLPGLDTACVICLSEFVTGECLRILPKCNHGFHTRCIDIWLSSHSSCPTCRHCLTETDQKTDNYGRVETLPAQEAMNIEEN
ncbi:putative RING zinc finger protein [Hibiscus syriacus]|uniref:RING-type E3 ubiquitin transferase n=1 Tax=Hibiscus syriacus TaxID=106335 RepID=A0A6A2WRJ3_HIBSY|nr:RING-H2 finger protein ATL78-like [Hibiscus syriacus]KAE8663643.1 putative RING zinc finger protein [Hibiscus syriacus]